MSNQNDDTSDDDGIDKMPEGLVQCSACLRRMRQEVFAKHPNTCRKSPSNKRHVQIFDMTRYRSVKTGDKIIPVRKVSSVNADKLNNIIVRPSQTRSAKRDRRSDALVPPVVDHFCCPICKRTFCEKAYDRHVEFCTNKIKQIQQAPSEQVLLARLKLDRRVKFGSSRISSTSSKPPAFITPPIPTSTVNKEATKPNPSFCLLPLRKKLSISLAHCPWCSKPYIPNCTHYCRNLKELSPIH